MADTTLSAEALAMAVMADNVAIEPGALSDVERDAARYRWLASHCRSTTEHWGGRWSIVVEGPAPASRDDEDAFDAAIDAAIARAHGIGVAAPEVKP